MKMYFVEQGPRLEAQEQKIGVVRGVRAYPPNSSG